MAGIFISGGCVTRDTYESIKGEHELTGYSARQSLISAASRPTQLGGDVGNEGFELRSLKSDLASDLKDRLAQAVDQTDLLVIDLLVERLGVLELPDGTFVTRTPMLNKSGAIGELFTTSVHVKFGTPRHFELWALAAVEFVRHLNSIDLLERTLLVETPWTGVTLSGDPVKPYVGWDPAEANETYSYYYGVLKGLGMKSLRLPEHLVVSDHNHKWGASPFHYAPATHEWLAQQFRAALP